MQNITAQAKKIYNALYIDKPLTAVQISDKLNILPHAVYRSVKVLVEFGFVRRLGRYSTLFMKNDPAGPIDLYVHDFKTHLLKSFSSNEFNNATGPMTSIEFISNRPELIKETDIDLGRAQYDACFIVSGLEVPNETVLAFKKALDKGVHIRIIVQNLNEVKKKHLEYWQNMGIEVKHFASIEARIIIFDSKICYITSYDPKKKEEGTGARFSYPPVAIVMQSLFEQRWKKAKKLG
jgi:sugar-specific transcriptional regulator TrmB